MPFDIDRVVGFHARALNLRAEQSEIIANNLANVDTPGFKARTLDFKEAMDTFTGKTISMAGDDDRHFSLKNNNLPQLELKYRTPQTAQLDGNDVDKDVETVAFARNATDYQSSLTFLNGAIKALKTAIRGE